jgi:hypothetical protein
MDISYRDITLPRQLAEEDSPLFWDYEHMRRSAGQLPYYPKIRLAEDVALGIASKTPYPAAVRVAVMKQLAISRVITLSQLRILLGWSAQKAQGAQVVLKNNLPYQD